MWFNFCVQGSRALILIKVSIICASEIILCMQIAGQLALEGLPLKKVAEVAQRVVNNMATMGLAIRSCVLPGSTQPLLPLAPGCVELGIGVHGEAGLKTVQVFILRCVLWICLCLLS